MYVNANVLERACAVSSQDEAHAQAGGGGGGARGDGVFPAMWIVAWRVRRAAPTPLSSPNIDTPTSIFTVSVFLWKGYTFDQSVEIKSNDDETSARHALEMCSYYVNVFVDNMFAVIATDDITNMTCLHIKRDKTNN